MSARLVFSAHNKSKYNVQFVVVESFPGARTYKVSVDAFDAAHDFATANHGLIAPRDTWGFDIHPWDADAPLTFGETCYCEFVQAGVYPIYVDLILEADGSTRYVTYNPAFHPAL